MPFYEIISVGLLLTIIIEASVLAVISSWQKTKPIPLVLWSIPINTFTQPLFSFWLKTSLYGQDYLWWQYFIIGECAVIIIETLLFYMLIRRKQVKISTCFIYSAIANFSSLSLGIVLPIP